MSSRLQPKMPANSIARHITNGSLKHVLEDREQPHELRKTALIVALRRKMVALPFRAIVFVGPTYQQIRYWTDRMGINPIDRRYKFITPRRAHRLLGLRGSSLAIVIYNHKFLAKEDNAGLDWELYALEQEGALTVKAIGRG